MSRVQTFFLIECHIFMPLLIRFIIITSFIFSLNLIILWLCHTVQLNRWQETVSWLTFLLLFMQPTVVNSWRILLIQLFCFNLGLETFSQAVYQNTSKQVKLLKQGLIISWGKVGSSYLHNTNSIGKIIIVRFDLFYKITVKQD